MLRLSVILLLIGLSSALGVSPYLGRLYATTRPTVADPASGRVYAHHHFRGGADVYLTQAEYWAVFGSFAGGVFLSALGGFLFERSRRRAGNSAA